MTASFGAFPSSAEGRSIHGIVEEGGLPSPISSPFALTSAGHWISEIRIRPIEMGGLAPQSYPLQTSIAIRSALSNLSPGDYVVLTGQFLDQDFDGQGDLLAVSGIESVGLKKLLGDWRNKAWDIFRFHDYNRLGLYRPASAPRPSSTLQFRKLKEMNYTLAPEAQGSFSLLMVETLNSSALADSRAKPVFVGRLQITNLGGVLLDVFDPNSGKPVESHALTPFESVR